MTASAPRLIEKIRPVIHLDGKKAQNYRQDYVIPEVKKTASKKKTA